MADSTQASQQLWNEQLAMAVSVAYGQAGYLDEDGEQDTEALAAKLLPEITAAVATRKGDRTHVGVTRRRLMEIAFPKITGPEAWADEDNPELAEALYKRLDGHCWALTAIKPNGPLQAQLNGSHGLIMLRTKVNPHQTDAVYVTRDEGCILEDALVAQRAGELKVAQRDAAFTAMLIERVPEHGKRWDSELGRGLRRALRTAQAESRAALEAATLFDPDEAGE